MGEVHPDFCPPPGPGPALSLAPAAASSREWPLLINPEFCRRRDLYEAVLKLELTGAVVIERPLGEAAVSLSATECICFWPEEATQVTLNANMELYALTS